MAGAVEDPEGCGQGGGMSQFCLTSVTGRDLVGFIVHSAWHYSAPLASVRSVDSSQVLIFWAPGKVVAAKMWQKPCPFCFHVTLGIWLCNMENSVSHRIFGSSCTGVWELGAVLS